MQYRKEIDGLRAVAVLPVILFHAGLSSFSGGYVGVDVFFVISGYLITQVIQEELRQGTFSLARFYERRARRILPALVLVILACIPFVLLWALPDERKDFWQSVVAVALFSSNILFWYRTDYFASAAETKPLLHTWSLGVEEQYYIVFPLLLLLLARSDDRRRLAVLASVVVTSFLLCLWASRHAPSANFFLAPFRAWELLIGSCCALLARPSASKAGNWIALGGLALILVSIVIFDETTPFPGFAALLPVGGTALLILFAHPSTVAARILSHRVLVGVGLISYSAYLWHQPLFAFARMRSLSEPSLGLMLCLAAGSLVLAYGSWRWVETPFRKKHGEARQSSKRALATSAIALGGLVALGLTGNARPDVTLAAGSEVGKVDIDRLAANKGIGPHCDGGFAVWRACRTGAAPQVVVWGDSFAMHLVPGLLASSKDLAVQQMTMSACSPVLGIAAVGASESVRSADNCIRNNDLVLQWLRSNPGPKTVILSSPFDGVTARYRTRSGQIVDGDLTALKNELRKTAAAIRETGAKVMIVSPTAMVSWDAGRCLVRSAMLGLPAASCDFDRPRDTAPFALLRSVEVDVPVYWLTEDLCGAARCRPAVGNVYLYRDQAHLSIEGSRYLGQRYGWARRFAALAR